MGVIAETEDSERKAELAKVQVFAALAGFELAHAPDNAAADKPSRSG
jgi:hypothetical protein